MSSKNLKTDSVDIKVTFLNGPEKKIQTGYLGCGYNVLDGKIKPRLFSHLGVNYKQEETKVEELLSFADYTEFERGYANKVLGPGQYIAGMFSQGHTKGPFLSSIQKLDDTQYFFAQHSHTNFKLSLVLESPKTIAFDLMKDKRIISLNGKSFDSETKKVFYSVFDKFGTHVVVDIDLGSKAELFWSYESTATVLSGAHNPPNTMAKAKLSAILNTKISAQFKKWLQKGFPDNYPVETVSSKELPPLSEVHSKIAKTPKFGSPDSNELLNFHLIGLPLLINNADLRSEFEVAYRVYLEERRPLRISEIDDGMVVSIRCLENDNIVRTDEEGHLFANVTQKQIQETPSRLDIYFSVKKKNNTFALKSYIANKLVSRASLRFKFVSAFSIGMGTYETFLMSGHYFVTTFGGSRPPKFIYLSADAEILPDGPPERKVSLILLPKEDPITEEFLQDDEEPQETISYHTFGEDEQKDEPQKDEPIKQPVSENPPKSVEGAAGGEDLYPGLKKKNPRVAALANEKKVSKIKSNSTSTFQVKDTLSSPDINELLWCVCAAIQVQIARGHQSPQKHFLDIFDETKHHLFKGNVPHPNSPAPTVEQVYDFLSQIFKNMELNIECAIVSFVYISRLINLTGVTLHVTNWRRILVSTTILASKVWEDLAVWNVDFLHLFKGITVTDLNRLEKHLLDYLQYNVTVQASLYAKCYFEVKEFARGDASAIATLNREAARRIEEKSISHEEKTRQSKMQSWGGEELDKVKTGQPNVTPYNQNTLRQ